MMRAALVLLAMALLPAAAQADPISTFVAVEAVLGATAAGIAATIVSYGSAILMVGAAVYGSVEARRKARAAAAAARAAYNASLSDRTITVLQADPPQRVVYGRARVGGAIVAMFTSDKAGVRTNGDAYTKPDGLKHLVIVFAAHRCKALNEVYIDGVAVGLASVDANGWATTGEFAGTANKREEVQLAAGASYTAPSAVTVSSCVEVINGGGDNSPADGTYTLSNGNKTITNTSGFTVAVSYTRVVSASTVRVSYVLGRPGQVVDAYLNGVMGSQWPSAATLDGLSAAFITLDLENTRFQGGPPGITFDVSGKLVYDHRANRANNATLRGAVAGTPGTLPTDWSASLVAGLSRQVVGSGTDDATGLPYVELRIFGTATASSNTTITLQSAALADTASPGQVWSGRCGLRLMAYTGAHATIRLALLSYDSGGTATLEASGNSITVGPSAAMQLSEVSDAGGLGASAVGVGLRVYISCVSGTSYDTTLRVLLPQLWLGTIDGTTDPVRFSANPAVCTADYLRSAQGMGVAYLDVNDAALAVAANACDVNINLVVDGVTTVGDTYTCNGSYTTDESQEGVLDALCQSMAGFAHYGADWIIRAGTWTPSVLALTDAELNGQVSIVQAGTATEAIFNGLRSSYLPLGATTPADSIYQNATFVAADGEELWTDQQLSWVNNPARARNLQRIFVERNRAGLVISYPAKLTAWPLQVGDRCTVTNAEYGWTAKLFRVTDWQFGIAGAVQLTLQEDDASIYDLADAATSDPTPNTNLPNPWVVDMPSGVAAASGTSHLQKLADGTVLPRAWVSWATVTDTYVSSGGTVEVLWRRAGQDQPNVWRTISAPGDSVGEYITGVRTGDTLNITVNNINAMGVRSKPVHLSHVVVGKSQPPADVADLDALIVYGAVRLSCNPTTELDVSTLVLRRGASWAAGVPLAGTNPTEVDGNEYLWAWPAYGTYTVWAKWRDTSGNYSSGTASVSVVVNDAIKLGSDGIDVDLAGINLCDNSSYEIDTDGDGLADGWLAYQAGSYGTITRSLVAGRVTGNAQRVYSSALGTTSSDRAGVRRDIPVGTGAIQQACISAWAWGSSTRIGTLLVYAMQGATVLDSQTVSVTFSGAGAWKRLVALMPAFPAAADTIRVYLWITNGTGGSAVLVLDDVLVEEGNVPSSWHPSPRDELIGTGMIEDGAATELYHYTDSAPWTHPSAIADTAFTAAAACNVVVNLGCDVKVDASAQISTKHQWWTMTANVVGTGSTPNPTLVSASTAGDRSDIAPGNIIQRSAVSQAVYQLQAGGTYRAYGYFANKVPQSTIPADPLSAVMRLELIKR